MLDLFRKIRFKLSKRIFSLNTSLLVTYEFKGEKILHISQFGKDGIQYVLRRDFTGNSAQMVQNFADVLSEQVSGNASCNFETTSPV